MRNVQFRFMQNAFRILKPFECFVTQVQTHLPKTKRVWPMKINVMCTVLKCHEDLTTLETYTTGGGGGAQLTIS